MKRILPIMVIASAVAAFGPPAFAKPGGSPAAAPALSPSPSSHAMTNSNGPFSTDRDFGRDRAEDRISADTHGSINSNGSAAIDRDFGRNRAEDRMSAQGQAHAKAPAPRKSKKQLASAKPVKPRAAPATPAKPPENGKV